jgi:hypothetical protein
MKHRLYCDECGNSDEFVVEYYNTLADSETIRDVLSDKGYKRMIERGAKNEQFVRVDCTECPNIVYE